jgi:hypothetical protein
MIKELSRLIDGSYIVQGESVGFHGSRIELLEYLADCGYSDAAISIIMQTLDSQEPVNLLANRQGYC